MTRVRFEVDGRPVSADTGRALDISIPIAFNAPQPNHFDGPPATSAPLAVEGFVGDTREGGSCNCEVVTLTAHCNGTHTESVGHVTDKRVSVHDAAPKELLYAIVVTVSPVRAEETRESTAPRPEPKDHVITRSELVGSIGTGPGAIPDALVVRTRPNDDSKRTRRYADPHRVPYFTAEAVEWLVEKNVRHLIVDVPSVDRMHDGGALTGHRIFWGLPPGSRDAADASRPHATITELAYLPDDVADGDYLLSLQVAPFVCDAAPSRPLLYPLEPA